MVRHVAEQILPRQMVEKLKELKKTQRYSRWQEYYRIKQAQLKIPILRFFSSHQFLSRLYYLLFSSDFAREQQSVLRGRSKYLSDVHKNSGSIYLLRRNIHRLEKGILMKPRRPVFALDYIQETVTNYANLLKSGQDSFGTHLAWAYDVLNLYFETVSEHPVVNVANNAFVQLPCPIQDDPGRKIPYKRNLEQLSNVSNDDLFNLALRRRSVRWFEPKEVPHELIDKAVAMAVQAPSACNRLPYEFRVFDEPEVVQKLVKLPTGTPGFRHNIPAIVVVIGKLEAYPFERDRHVIYIDASLASMSFVLALESLGLSSCCINWPDIEHLEVQMSKTLSLEKDERVIMLIAIGYPDPEGLVAYSQKPLVDEVRRFNS